MKVKATQFPEVLLVEPRLFGDSRGSFMESYSFRRYAAAGMPARFVQDNHSQSRQNVVRGLHYQLAPGQAKLIRVLMGCIHDVVVDIRRGSPTFGTWIAVELSAVNRRQIFIPAGFAHGFSVLSETAEVEYKVDRYYNPELERGIAYDDPELAIDWQVQSPIVSDRDQVNPTLADAELNLVYAAMPG